MKDQLTLSELNKFLRVMLYETEQAIYDEGFTVPTQRLLDIRTELLQDLLKIQIEDFNKE